MENDQEEAGLEWQVGVWDRISRIHLQEVDQRFAPVVENVVARAELKSGQQVLDLGTGTGAVMERVAPVVRPRGDVVGIDISRDMLALA